MPGTNAGTGRPLTLKCAKCKKQQNWYIDHNGKRDWSAKTGKIVRTGRVRGEKSKWESVLRMLSQHHEYECLECGHVGWTRKTITDILFSWLVPRSSSNVVASF